MNDSLFSGKIYLKQVRQGHVERLTTHEPIPRELGTNSESSILSKRKPASEAWVEYLNLCTSPLRNFGRLAPSIQVSERAREIKMW